jgi:hypothetical protein
MTLQRFITQLTLIKEPRLHNKQLKRMHTVSNVTHTQLNQKTRNLQSCSRTCRGTDFLQIFVDTFWDLARFEFFQVDIPLFTCLLIFPSFFVLYCVI